MIIKNKSNYKGFSLIESILAVFVVTVGIVGAIDLMSSGLKESIESRNQLVAGFLAQDGVELAKNVRDNDWISDSVAFDRFPVATANNCRIDYLVAGNLECNDNQESKRLKLDSVTKLYAHSGDTDTKYQRRLIFTYNGTMDSVEVVSQVIWGRAGNDFPDVSDCSAATKCAYASVSLVKNKFF